MDEKEIEKEIERQVKKILFMVLVGTLLMPFGFALNWLIKNNLTPFEPTNSEIKSIIIAISIFILLFVLTIILFDEELD